MQTGHTTGTHWPHVANGHCTEQHSSRGRQCGKVEEAEESGKRPPGRTEHTAFRNWKSDRRHGWRGRGTGGALVGNSASVPHLQR